MAPRSHAIDSDAVRSQLGCCHFRELLHPSLAGRVADEIRKSDLVAARPDVDDASASPVLHVPAGKLRAQETALQVRVDHSIPVVLGELQEGRPNLGACVVDEDVQARVAVKDLVEHASDLDGFPDRCLDDDSCPAFRTHDSRNFLGPFRVRVVMDRNIAAERGQPCRDSSTDALARSGHERGLSREIHVAVLRSLSGPLAVRSTSRPDREPCRRRARSRRLGGCCPPAESSRSKPLDCERRCRPAGTSFIGRTVPCRWSSTGTGTLHRPQLWARRAARRATLPRTPRGPGVARMRGRETALAA